MCFQDVKEYASALDSLLHSKVALHTSQQHSLQGSGYYFKDWASQNSSALPCAENLIISSLYKLLKSLHKCTCCSQFPQKKKSFKGFSVSLVFVQPLFRGWLTGLYCYFYGLRWMYSYFCPAKWTAYVFKAVSYISIPSFPEA